ncbi:SSI family serine proteinase inhibitor [Glycomyces tenuis]|uniref:SSI family serine proteinase inhibitor n=1 Tax=Glycomyces tenuis TaxID=58116 RepID=UPI00042305BB|nr:SSI family serine proteinase inhibitor [Glycomyces tenuis]
MVKKLSRALAVLGPAAFAVFTATGAVGAQAQPSHPVEPLQGGSAYYVEVEFSDGAAYDAVLMCPGGGGHPHGAEVCAQLTEVDGDIGSLGASDGLCTMDYRPVTVRAHGLWNGDFHSYEGQFGNYCAAVGHTGGRLFDIVPR